MMPEDIEIELEQQSEPDQIEVQIVDDVPEDLRQPERRSDNKAPELTPEEESQVGPRVQKRIARITYEKKELERRAHEADQKVIAAMKVAQAAIAHQNQLAARVNELQAGIKQEALGSREARATQLRYEITKAKETGDSEKEAQLIQEMAEIAASKAAVQNWNPATLQQVEVPTVAEAPPPPTPQQEELDQETVTWAQRNTSWLQKVNSSPEAAAAYQHANNYQKLLAMQGHDTQSRKCYDLIDEELRRRFPDVVSPSAPSRTVSAVTGASRVNTAASGKRVIKLTAAEAAVADGLGIPYKEYAEYLQKGAQ
jgi:hypothetical protein